MKIHRVDAQEQFDKEAQRILGKNPFYFAFRNDAAFVAGGAEGLSVMKEALALTPKASVPLRVEFSLASLAAPISKDQKAAPQAAKEAFAKDKDSDKIRFTVEGGKALKLRFDMKAQVIKFFSLLQKAEKAE